MPPTAVLLADIIGSKRLASQPGGIPNINNLRQGMRDFLDTNLAELNCDDTLTITEQVHQGDDVQYRIQGANLREIAAISLAVVKAAFASPDGKRFRFVVYRVESDVAYQPRIKAFGEISKTAEGRNYHIAVERSIVTALDGLNDRDREIITWLRKAPSGEMSLTFEGEGYTGVHVYLYCPLIGKVSTDLAIETQQEAGARLAEEESRKRAEQAERRRQEEEAEERRRRELERQAAAQRELEESERQRAAAADQQRKEAEQRRLAEEEVQGNEVKHQAKNEPQAGPAPASATALQEPEDRPQSHDSAVSDPHSRSALAITLWRRLHGARRGL